ncbi:Peptidyl-prolyl cis-trans isomerase [Hondaea fermentalgiana]|uniref:Peptidyl-prolyl cis-trans isomerase n=1 Tax=Hondaea fermentalgiana TaxID=2315210 RepID=A0A2R5G9Q6_9STRA|nr:Peptidyl-prolyl cis-trans isomerase [Hondaea fermentalgiana]|eukprot:GBG27295.1 Peptidyl-prolyl cis-trans isomerase [Hondaea fermentalgiana]
MMLNKAKTFALVALFVAVVAAFVVAPAQGAKASASHILVPTEEAAEKLKERIAGGEDFAELAKEHSSCPSKNRGGALGSFGPGQMVPEFNDVVFGKDYEVGTVHGPVKTQFGYHLILITERDL